MVRTRKDPAEAGSLRFYYRNWRPAGYGRLCTRIWAWATSLGLLPDTLVTLLVKERLDVERAFHPCNISTKETNDRGDSSHEGDRGDGPGCGNGRDEAGRAARAAGGGARQPLGRELRRCHCPGSCVGIHWG